MTCEIKILRKVNDPRQHGAFIFRFSYSSSLAVNGQWGSVFSSRGSLILSKEHVEF